MQVEICKKILKTFKKELKATRLAVFLRNIYPKIKTQ